MPGGRRSGGPVTHGIARRAWRAAGLAVAVGLTVATTTLCDPLPCATDRDCDDGNPCDGVETCMDGLCLPGRPVLVDDGNPCTIDSCDPIAGARNDPVADGTPCPDGIFCNGAEACLGGVCMPGRPVLVNDDNPCTIDSCDEMTGAVYTPVPDGTPCPDRDPCDGDERCIGGFCTAGPVSDPTCPNGGCLAAPQEGCNPADRSTVTVRKGMLRWRWHRGPAIDKSEFGAPTTNTTYRLCLYDEVDGAPRLVAGFVMPPGSRWTEIGAGFRYADPTGAPDGIRRAHLLTASTDRSRIAVFARGVTSLAQPGANARMQLVGGLRCWE